MKKLSALIMLVLPMITVAQEIKQNGIDPFSNKATVETSMESLLSRNKFKNQWNEVRVALKSEDGKYTIPASILMDKTQQFNTDCFLVLRLANGRVISLNASSVGEAMNSERGPLGVATQTRVAPFKTVYIGLTDEDVKDLRLFPVTNIRVTSEMTNFDYEIKGKNSELFIRMLKLIDNVKRKY